MGKPYEIAPAILEIVERNQSADQNGMPHPNSGIFGAIEIEMKRFRFYSIFF